jgi:hypothetical protein
MVEDCEVEIDTGELLPVVTIVTDNGGPFPSFRFEAFITAHPELAHVRTKVNSPGQNGSRERGFGTLKYERLFIDEIDDAVMLAKHAEEYRRGGPSPRSFGVPRPDAPARACAPTPARPHAPAAATDPSAGHRHAPWPASDARSARAGRTGGRTSWSTCPPGRVSPRGPRRAQPALRGPLPDPDLHRGRTQSLGQLGDLGLQLLLPGRRTGLTGRQGGLADHKEIGLPPADRLLADPLPPSRSAIVNSPARTLSTIRVFISTGIDGGLPICRTLLQD